MSKEAMKLALEALKQSQQILDEYMTECVTARQANIDAIKALEEALAKQEQSEPVAMRYDFDGYGYKYIDSGSGSDWKTRIKDAEPVYTTPQQRTWVGLDPEEIRKTNHHMVDGAYHYSFKQGAEWAEAKLKEKNT
jgi:hypothetical protein